MAESYVPRIASERGRVRLETEGLPAQAYRVARVGASEVRSTAANRTTRADHEVVGEPYG
jgi:hypothetical protein